MGVSPGDTLKLEKMTSMSTLGVEENMWDLMYYRLEVRSSGEGKGRS